MTYRIDKVWRLLPGANLGQWRGGDVVHRRYSPLRCCVRGDERPRGGGLRSEGIDRPSHWETLFFSGARPNHI